MDYFLVLLKPSRATFPGDATPEESAIVLAHFNYYKDLNEKGLALIVGRTEEQTPTGIALLKVQDLSVAEQLMNGDPAVQRGLMIAKVKPFRMALKATTYVD